MESGFAAMIACEEARTLDNVEGKYLGYRVAFLRDVVLQAGNVASITGKLITHAVSASVGGAAAVVGMGVANIVIGGLSYHVARADVQKSGKVLGKIASVARNLDRCVAQSQETGGVKAVLAERKQYGPGCIEGALRAARYERHVAVSSGIFEAMQVSRRLLAQALNNESKESNELKDAKRRIAYGVVSASCGAATLVAIIVLGANPWLLVGGAVVSLIAGAIWQGYLSHKNRNVAAPDADATMARSRQLDKDVSMTVEMLARRSSEATLARKLVKAVLTDIGLSRKYFALHKLAQYSGNPLIMDRMDRFMERQIRHLVASSGARQRIDAPSDN
ncbi:hypothetical protein LMG32289_06184 [Cupriavidus pampae]|uniref:Uncharacterized protein n=2 Tax=Cupriavidus pampae TaxID=659251 RepID=A0ABM8XZX8_9BURK|nr:hypothetical protein LMG32289_06184 [Cupriavidus pampae]